MDHYDFPLWHSPKELEHGINVFFQAKFGLFTCHDLDHQLGKARYDPELVKLWIKKDKELKYTWYMAIAYSLVTSKVGLEDLSDYRKNYREGALF